MSKIREKVRGRAKIPRPAMDHSVQIAEKSNGKARRRSKLDGTDWEGEARKAGSRVKEMARGLGVSPQHLRRHFLQSKGVPLGKWLKEQLLSPARERLMADSAAHIKDLAKEFGYQGPTSFTRAFKKHYGFVPSEVLASRMMADQAACWP
jgi:AraC-like DNA-binding protein